MRRSDKEIKDSSLLYKILKRAQICRIGLIDVDKPYIVPMNFGYRDGHIYLHSAPEGRKIDILKRNNQVCFQIDCGIELIRAENPCQFGMKYYSIIGWGKTDFIENFIDKSEALNIIMDKYGFDGICSYDEELVDEICILVINIEKLTAKISGY